MHIPPKIRKAVRERSEGLCEICLPGCARFSTEIHHVKSAGRGGKSTLRNLLDVCFSCHRLVSLNKPGTEKFRTYAWQKEGETEADAPEWKGVSKT